MYDFGTAHNFWIDIPVPQGDVFRQLSILNVQDSVLLTCIGALMNKSWKIFQQPTILYIFDMTGLTWLMRTCRNLPKEVLNIGTCARNGGEDLRNFWSWHTFFCHAFPQLFKSVFFDWKKSIVQGEDLSDDDIQAEFWWKSALRGVSTQCLEETLLFGGRNANSSESSWALHLDPNRIDEEIHQQATP